MAYSELWLAIAWMISYSALCLPIALILLLLISRQLGRLNASLNTVFSNTVLIVVIVAIASMHILPAEWLKYERGVNLWISSLILIVLSILYIGKASMGSFLGLLLDKDGNTSASQLQQVLWTIVIISALIAAVSLNIAAKYQTNSLDPLKITISSDLWYLMGITSVSLAGSPMIKRDKSQARSLRRNRGYLFAIVYKDLDANSTQLDLGKVQMLYLTLIILLAYSLQIAALFSGKSITEFPQISPGVVTLLGISNAGYLAFKASQLN